MKKERNAHGARPGRMAGALLWLALGMACMQSDPGPQVAGSATELGNVMGVLVTSDRRAAAGVEVKLYPLEEGPAQGHVLVTTTDANGAFAFDVEGGVFRLLALDGAGSGVTMDSLIPSPEDTLDLQEIKLAALGGIRGFVKSKPSGAELGLHGTPFDTAFPGDAEFVWEGIPAGTYGLQARQLPGVLATNSLWISITVAPGVVTALPDTLDLTTIPLELLSAQLPYRLSEGVRPANGLMMDSIFWVLNGVRIESPGPSARMAVITLTETMLDSARANVLEMFAHSGDSVLLARTWSITWKHGLPAKWAYQAMRAVITTIESDNRPSGGRRVGGQPVIVSDPQLGTFRVLEKRRLSPEELAYWEWPAGAGGDAFAPDSFQAFMYSPPALLPRGCRGKMTTNPLHLPGDTVTFFLLPDSLLGGVAYRLRTDEQFQYMDRLGYFARADWPMGESFTMHRKQLELRTDFLPEGMRIEWPLNYMFQGSDPRCQSTYRRFLVDSTGRVRESLITPAGIDPSRLLLHYRADFGNGIDADSLASGGDFVYIDSTGQGVSGSGDSIREFRLEPADLEALETLLSGLPDPVPADWQRELADATRQEGVKESLRYLVGDRRGVLHIQDHPEAAPAKADLFSRVDLWLRGRILP